MPVSVTMPRLGESVTEGTVTRWLKQVGDRVEVDEPLVEVSTDKVDTEIPSPAAGVLSRIVVAEDETAPVGSELAVIAGEGEGDAGTAAGPPVETGAAAAAPPPAPASPPPSSPALSAAPSSPAPSAAAPSSPAPSAAAPSSPAPSAAAPQQGSGPQAGGVTVRMPALGESVTEGTVTRWLKQVGDSVEADEPLLEVSTDKVDTEIPAPVSGVVLEIKVAEDDVAPVGAELAVIGSAGTATQAAPKPIPPVPGRAAQAAPQSPARPAQPPAAPTPPPPTPAAPAAAPAPSPVPWSAAPAPAPAQGGDNGSVYVTPLVRKLASERGVDLRTLAGTGVGGRIRKQDVLDAAVGPAGAATRGPGAPPASRQPSPLRGRTEKLSRLRAVIARRMVESLQVSAQLTTIIEIDVTRIAKLRDAAKADFQARHGVKLSFLPFFALATAEALQVHPKLNASLDMEQGTVTYHSAEHLGIAVDTERGLVVPVVRDAGDLNLGGLAKRIADLADRTRGSKISPDELSGGTFTITNTGSLGVLFDTPIINQPQVGILGTGAVVRRAVVVDDPVQGEGFAIRSMVYLSLSYDHRLVDGADAARFLATLKERLEAGNFEAELGL